MINQLKYLILDLKRWDFTSFRKIFYNIFEQGVWVTILYRLSRLIYLIEIPILRILLRLIGFFIFKFSELFLGIAIPPGANIGPGFYIGHTGSIRINYAVIAGKNLSIGPGVIIGSAGLGRKGVPIIGDNVYVGTGAKILGNIKIGNNVKIGANAVVIKNALDNATLVGVPAHNIERK